MTSSTSLLPSLTPRCVELTKQNAHSRSAGDGVTIYADSAYHDSDDGSNGGDDGGDDDDSDDGFDNDGGGGGGVYERALLELHGSRARGEPDDSALLSFLSEIALLRSQLGVDGDGGDGSAAAR
jgi:hypothetical protein